ncbi:MAG TPA: phosphatase PAP2 family protein [Kofleriaceae bacterium]|nr:phosphatase PAP2 family protein [Kofleriaceae bacterium]
MKDDVLGYACSPVATLAAAAGTAALLVKHTPDEAARFAIAVPVACGIGKLLKKLVHEPRPELFLDDQPMESFPSGHSAAMTAFALSAVAATRRWWMLPIAAGAVAAVNISRVRQREHWAWDVIAGDLVGVAGFAAGAAAAYAVRHARKRRRERAMNHAPG